MPIEGDLKSLNFASILQLIAQERLSGVLKIRKKNELVDIGIYESMVTGAFYEKGDRVDRLEDYLVRSGIIKKNLFDMVQEIHQETKRPIMSIIIEDKYLTVEEVERIIRFKIQEVLDEVFTWQEGAFKFEQGSVIYPKSMLKIRLNIESLVLEAARRFDEWPKIQKTIPSGDLVYKKIEHPELKLRLSEDEERVANMLDGNRCVDDVIEISGLGKFHTYSCLYHLLTSGQVELAYAKPRAEQTRVKRKTDFSLKFLKTPAIIALIIFVALLEIIIGNSLARKSAFSFTFLNTEDRIPGGRGESTDADHDLKKIFFYRYNRMPSDAEIQNIFYGNLTKPD
jgi:hypothetical protein